MTWIHFLAPASSGSQPPESLPSRDPTPFLACLSNCTYVVHINTLWIYGRREIETEIQDYFESIGFNHLVKGSAFYQKKNFRKTSECVGTTDATGYDAKVNSEKGVLF